MENVAGGDLLSFVKKRTKLNEKISKYIFIMSNFSFNSLANTTGVASDKRLRPYSINEVKFVEAKVDVLHSDKKQEDYDI